MKPFRKHVAISIDGGGLKGVMVTRALLHLEDRLGHSLHEVCRLTTGTSTGAIIAAGIAAGVPVRLIHSLYLEHGPKIFKPSLRSLTWPLHRYRFSQRPLREALDAQIGDMRMEAYLTEPATNIVLTTFDVTRNKVHFIKPWKEAYRSWRVVDAVLASSAVPTILPVFEGRYVDGGIGSYANPAYLAAYEIANILAWPLHDTTLISIGTGRDPHTIKEGHADRLFPLQWIRPLISGFMQVADDQQVHLVHTFFKQLDFRRFQIDFDRPVGFTDPREMERLEQYGDRLGDMIVNDEWELPELPEPVPHHFSVLFDISSRPLARV